MAKYIRNPHFWIILTIMIFGALFYYADEIPILKDIVALPPFQFLQYSTYRILSLTPVAYAAFVFRWRAGVVTATIVGLALLPRAVLQSIQAEALSETIAFFFIGLLVTWLIHRQQQTVQQLVTAQGELENNVRVIRENEKRLSAINRMASTISTTLDLDQVLNSAIDNVVDVMQADAAWIFLRDEKEPELILAASRGAPDDLSRGIDHIKIGEGFNGRVAATGEPLFIEDASNEPRLTREIVKDYHMHATLIVPIISKQEVNGTLCIGMFKERQFSPQEKELLSALGHQVGIALENARLYRQQQHITQQLRQSEEEYRGIFENSSDALFVCSTSARIVSANRAAVQLTGLTLEELKASTIFDLLDEPDRPTVQDLFPLEVENLPTGSIGEVSVVRKDGTDAVVELKVSPLFRRGRISGIQIIAQDVTEEKKLRRNMEYYIKQVTQAQEDERLRISRELHDDTAQLLANLSRSLNTIVTGDDSCNIEVLRKLEKLQETADSALEGVRRFSQDLRPSILDDLGLVPALEWLITDLEKYQGVTASFEVEGERSRLAPETELTIFRITQEALSNIRRHSGATEVKLRLAFTPGALTVSLNDNGKGFAVPEHTSDLARTGRLGMIGMRERARLINAALKIDSEKGKGTRVTLRVPR